MNKSTLKIPWAKPHFFGNEQEYVAKSLKSTWISDGEFVHEFERRLSELHDNLYCISTANGTCALQLALLVSSIKEGDEVIVPGYTFVSPVNMILAQKAKPVFVDVDPRTWCIAPEKIEEKITGRTKAILPVHIYGNVCAMDSINALAAKHGLLVIEDTAQALFSKYKGAYAGTCGDIGCFSTQATKTVTTGEGGFILTRDKKFEETSRIIRNHGMNPEKRYWHERIGFNFRITNLQAALGCAQLEHAEAIIRGKKAIFEHYKSVLSKNSLIRFQEFDEEADPVVWSVAVALEKTVDRDDVLRSLLNEGIECRPGYYPFSDMPPYSAPPLKNSSLLSSRILNLPSFSSITEEEINLVCQKLINNLDTVHA